MNFAYAKTPIENSKLNQNAETLSKDKEFLTMYNSMFTVIEKISKANVGPLLEKYERKTATTEEVRRLYSASGFKSEAELQSFYKSFSVSAQKLSRKFSFLADRSSVKETISEALKLSIKSNQIKTISASIGEDCLGFAATMIAGCTAWYMLCLDNPEYTEDYCIWYQTSCLLFWYNFMANCVM